MSIVRLSDNEISKILSIPMSLVSDNNIDEQAKNVNVQPVTSTTLCDSTNRNLLHLNKVHVICIPQILVKTRSSFSGHCC